MTLYNLHGDGPYTISKFTRDGTLESTYELSTDGRTCTCPAGHRHSCRHRDMLGALRPLANTEWFYDWDRGIAVDFNSVPKSYYDSVARPAMVPADQPVPEGLRVASAEEAYGTGTPIDDIRVGGPESSYDLVIDLMAKDITPAPAEGNEQDTAEDTAPAPAKPWRRL